MVSAKMVARALAILHETYPNREITPQTAQVWRTVLADIDDAQLEQAAIACSREPGRTFFPAPSELLAHVPRPPQIDATTLLKQIERYGAYDPRAGWRWPGVEAVRERFGDGVATAYGAVGPARFASEQETTRNIALRDFAQEIRALPAAQRPRFPALAAPVEPRQIPAET